MKYAKECLSSFLICSLLLLGSCKTKTYVPPPLIDNVASWDENEQNSGLIDYLQGEGFLLTERAAERYISLTEKYGDQHTPPLKKGEGLVKKGENYILPNEYMVEFIVMSQKHKTSIQSENKKLFFIP